MLHKPSNPSPYNAVVDSDVENLSFAASCLDTSDINKLRLAIKDSSNEYYLPVQDIEIENCKSGAGISLSKAGALSSLFQMSSSYKIAQSSNYKRTKLGSGVTIGDIINPNMQYRWQLRLYESACNTNIAYGFIEDVISDYVKNGTNWSSKRILKVRPHVNMFKGHGSYNDNNVYTEDSAYNARVKNKSYLNYYDDNVVYEIEISGKRYKVQDYYYAKNDAYYSKNTSTANSITIQTDSYGEPLFAYIEIAVGNDEDRTNEDGTPLKTSTFADCEYSIYANYIDSNEYYFSCRQLETMVFTDVNSSNANNTVNFTSVQTLNIKDNLYTPNHSNVRIRGTFGSNVTARVKYYRATLYQVLYTGEVVQIHDSGYVYSSEVDYVCRTLFGGETYQLIISISDTYGNICSYGVYIKPKYKVVAKPTSLSVEPYPEHNSVILNFGGLLSISGTESNPYDGSHHIRTLSATFISAFQKYLGISLFSGGAETITVKYCHIASDNSVSYSKVDRTGEAMQCRLPMISATFTCSKDYQLIFEFVLGKYKYILTWERYYFHLQVGEFRSFSQQPRIISHHDEIVAPVPPSHTIYVDGVYHYYYTPYQYDSLSKMTEAMQSSEINYTVPYMASEVLGADEDLYMHTESVSSDFWWHVIVTDDKWYIRCVNPPTNTTWQNEREITIPKSDDAKDAKLTLYGGCSYCNIVVAECGDNTTDSINALKKNPLQDLIWDDDTVFQTNFNSGLTGGNFEGAFLTDQYATIDHFEIYKKHSDQPYLYKVCETDDANMIEIEDFSVGSMCPYTYYVVPICYTNGQQTTGSILQSEPLTLNDGVIRVIGLIPDGGNPNTYYVDLNNIWNFSFNISDTGFQNNFGRTYNDTPQRFPIDIKNKGFYRTFNISGLLGKLNCDNENEYDSIYDEIIEWENFINDGEMKLIIDLRGVMTVGTIESNSFDYSESGAQLVTANFSVCQLDDINNVTILNHSALYVPDGEALLFDSEDLAIQDSDGNYLTVKVGE